MLSLNERGHREYQTRGLVLLLQLHTVGVSARSHCVDMSVPPWMVAVEWEHFTLSVGVCAHTWWLPVFHLETALPCTVGQNLQLCPHCSPDEGRLQAPGHVVHLRSLDRPLRTAVAPGTWRCSIPWNPQLPTAEFSRFPKSD